MAHLNPVLLPDPQRPGAMITTAILSHPGSWGSLLYGSKYQEKIFLYRMSLPFIIFSKKRKLFQKGLLPTEPFLKYSTGLGV
jgi:hypothetical protein